MKLGLSRSHIRWQCRRGMLELDLILSSFCEKHLETIIDNLLEDFAFLLNHTDQELYDWLVLNQASYPERVNDIINKIRSNH